MCDTCGCGQPGTARREEALLETSLLAANDARARENRAHFLDHGVLAVNLMSAPGSGKTSLIEALVRQLAGRLRVGALLADLATDRDAARLDALGIPAHQVTTGTACHLDAAMVHAAMHRLPLDRLDLLFVENVGNLVCPGLFDLGCQLNGVLLSVTEGDDKVAKYPVAFRLATFFCLTKTDLLPHVAFDPARPLREAVVLKGDLRVFRCSAVSGDGVGDLLSWLLASRPA